MLEKNFPSKSRAHMVQLKEELKNFKKIDLKVNDYVFKIKMLCDKLEIDGDTVTNRENFMYVLGGINESFDHVFSTLIEKMLIEKTTIGDAKALLLSHKNSEDQYLYHFYLV